jgi:vitamin B12 transporter
MKKILFVFLLAVLFVIFPYSTPARDLGDEATDSGQAAGGDESAYQLKYYIVVTANRTDTPQQELGSAITVITESQLEKMQETTVLDALRTVPALDVVQVGGDGGQASVFIRGAKSEHTLVLLDGVEMNDPSTPGRSVDLANLATADVERIEVIRGPQSVLYGSDAMGGVINIISKTGRGKLGGFFRGGYGSFNSFAESAGLNGGNRWADFSLGVSRSDTDGISAARGDKGNLERDGYRDTTISGKLGINPTKNVHADFILRTIDSRTDLDNAGGAEGDDPNNTAAAKQIYSRVQARISLFNGRWEQKIGFSLSRQERHYKNDTDAAHPVDSDRSTYNGQILRFDWQHDLRFLKANMLTMGIESEQEKGESEYYSESAWGPYASLFPQKSALTTAGYIQDHIRLTNDWFATLGARLDSHDRFGTKATYRLASTYLVRKTGTRIKASFGTGFKTPSLYQLYSLYGDKDLKPETSTGWDLGIEQSWWSDRISLGVTYFGNEFKQLIDYDSAIWKYMNVGEAKTSGVELFASVQPLGALTLQAGYTYTATQDVATGKDLLRRAKHKLYFVANCGLGKKGNANLEVNYVGSRYDTDYSTWPASRVKLEGYVLINLALGYDLSGRMRIFAGVKNLGNAKYEEILGYGTAGISASTGIKYSF